MMVKWAAFSLSERTTHTVHRSSWFTDRVTETEVPAAKYRNTHELYDAVAEFAAGLGERVISISGTPWGENSCTYLTGDIVVWYRG